MGATHAPIDKQNNAHALAASPETVLVRKFRLELIEGTVLTAEKGGVREVHHRDDGIVTQRLFHGK